MAVEARIVESSQSLVIELFKSMRQDLLGAFGNIEFSSKPDKTQVTEWDMRVENTLRIELEREFPGLGFEGEETGQHGNKHSYWLVDPIDGTSGFIRGIPVCTNMAALVDNGEVVAAVIYDFVRDVTYTAIKGQGSFKDGEKLSVNNQRQPGNFIMYSLSPRKFGLLQEAGREMGIRMLLPIGASGSHYLALAEGKIDGIAIIYVPASTHDFAPGMLIAEEAGAVVLPFDEGEGINRRRFMVGTPSLIDTVERSGLF